MKEIMENPKPLDEIKRILGNREVIGVNYFPEKSHGDMDVTKQCEGHKPTAIDEHRAILREAVDILLKLINE